MTFAKISSFRKEEYVRKKSYISSIVIVTVENHRRKN